MGAALSAALLQSTRVQTGLASGVPDNQTSVANPIIAPGASPAHPPL